MNTIRVWDLPTRVFHWSLLVLFIGMIITGEVAGDALVWHFRLGYCVLTLLVFRLIWGFLGGHWSRFTTFVVSPFTALAYLKGRHSPEQSIGHNPMGSFSVLALLGLLLCQVLAGMMSDDEILAAGPLVSKVPAEWVSIATFLHTEVFKLMLIFLVLLHVAAILWYRFKKQENLVKPMLNGDKVTSASVVSSRDDTSTRLKALFLFSASAFLVWAFLQWAS